MTPVMFRERSEIFGFPLRSFPTWEAFSLWPPRQPFRLPASSVTLGFTAGTATLALGARRR